MTEALKDFHKNVLTKDYNKNVENLGTPTDSFYEALSWVGLRDRGVAEYDTLSQNEKDEIDKQLQNVFLLSKANPCD